MVKINPSQYKILFFKASQFRIYSNMIQKCSYLDILTERTNNALKNLVKYGFSLYTIS